MLHETWSRSYEPNMKLQSDEWRHYVSPLLRQTPYQLEISGDSRAKVLP